MTALQAYGRPRRCRLDYASIGVAAEMWARGEDTKSIADAVGYPEHRVAASLEMVREMSKAMEGAA